MVPLTRSAVGPLIQHALREDVGRGDLTGRSLLPGHRRIRAVILAKQPGVVAGVQIAAWVFQELDRRIRCTILCYDGHAVRVGQSILQLEGPAQHLLAAERTALNFLGHLSGIATLTRQFVARVQPYHVDVLDTRKTLPGLRTLEKFAVRMGGGKNHRQNLDSIILVKANYLRAGKMDIGRAIRRAKRIVHGSRVQAEVRNLAELDAALRARPHVVMLDNWSLPAIRRAVALRNAQGRTPLLEVSGGITLQNIRRIAQTGVDRISIGRLTHSAPALDISLAVSDSRP